MSRTGFLRRRTFGLLFCAGRHSRKESTRRSLYRSALLGEGQSKSIVSGIVDSFYSAVGRKQPAGWKLSKYASTRPRLEQLEDRRLLSFSYVDDPGTYHIDPGTHYAGDWFVETDQGTLGILDAGDTVTWQKGVSGKETSGLTWETDAFGTIQAAINAAASSGDTIYVAQGAYAEFLIIDRSVNIEGDGPAVTILDGDNLNIGISISDGGVTTALAGLKIRNWDSGVWVEGATVALSNSIVVGSDNNGVSVVDGGTVTIVGCDVTGNRYGVSAGTAIQSGYASVIDSDLTGNLLTGLRVLAKGAADVSGSNLSGYTGGGQKAITNTNLNAIVDASGNYWGSTNDTTILGYTTGQVDITPYLSAAAASQPEVGFAGDYSDVYVTTLGRQTGLTGRVQEGIDAVAETGTVYVLAGTYSEQVVIEKSLTLEGAGDDTVVRPAAAQLTTVLAGDWGGTTKQIAGVIVANVADGSAVTIRSLKIDGQDIAIPPAGAQYVAGIFYRETGGLIEDVSVTNIVPGVGGTGLRGDAIYLSAVANTVAVEVEGVNLTMFDKNGIDAYGTTLTAYVHGSTVVTGRGELGEGEEVQNGIVIGGGAVGQVDGNVISGMVYTPETWWTTGIMFYNADGSASGNVISDVQIGIIANNGNLTATNNQVSGAATKLGIYSQADKAGSWTAVFTGNNRVSDADTYGIGAATYHAGASITVNISGNTVSDGPGDGIAVGDLPEWGPAGSVTGTISGNTIYGMGGAGVRVLATADVTVENNVGSIYGNAIGIDVDGGSATISGNAIYGNAVGIRFTAGGTGSVADNDFDDAVDNATDLRIDSTAGMVTVGDGNQFAGDNYYIDNRSALVFDLSAYSSTTFDVSDPSRDDNFEIEDRMYHAPDDSAGGLITWVAGNLYVTTPGTGSSDETIQRAIDAASPGNTVNVEAGTFTAVDRALAIINKPLTLRGAGEDIAGTILEGGAYGTGSDGTGLGNNFPRAIVVQSDGVTIENLRITNFQGDGTTSAGYGVVARAQSAWGVTEPTIDVLTVQDVAFVDVSYGVRTQNTTGLLIQRTNYGIDDGAAEYAFYVVASVGTVIRANVVDQGPIWVTDATDALIGGTTAADGNLVTNAIYNGIWLGQQFAAGTSSSGTIRFNTVSGAYEGGIVVWNWGGEAVSGIQILDNVVNGAEGHWDSHGGISIYQTDSTPIVISRNEVSGNTIGGITLRQSNFTNLDLTNNLITNNSGPGVLIELATLTDIDLLDNAIYGNTSGATVTGGSGTLDASGNWWGSFDPAVVKAAANGGTRVDFSPWLHSGDDIDGGAVGFQGDFSYLHVDDDSPQVGATGRIQEALGLVDLSDGTIQVEAGTYAETPNLARPFSNLAIVGNVNAFGRPETDTTLSRITGGMKFANTAAIGAIDGLTLENLYLQGNAGNNRILFASNSAPIYDFTLRNSVVDGDNVADRVGLYGNLFSGTFAVTGNEFKDILGFAVLDTDAASDYSPWGGNGLPFSEITFSGNYIHECNGSVALRGHYTDRTDTVTVENNIITNIGGNQGYQGEQWAGIEVNHAENVTIANNEITQVHLGIWGEGEALQLWDVSHFNIHHNILADNYQGIWIFGGDVGDPYGGPWAIPAGTIYYNDLSGNTDYGLKIQDTAVGTSLDARYNWWGSINGPAAAANTFNVGSQGAATGDRVDFVRWLDSGVDAEPGTLGFQPAGGLFAPVWNSEGEYYSSIQAAVVGTESAGTVYFTAGSYTESVDLAGKAITLSPGGSPAQVTIQGNLTMDADDGLVVELTGYTPGSGYDQLVVVSGSVILGDATLSGDLGSFDPIVGTVFTIIDSQNAISGTFAGLPEGATTVIDNIPFTVSYLADGGCDVTLTLAAPAEVWVNDTWVELVNGGGTPGVVDYGDIVVSDPSATPPDEFVTGKIFGYNAYAAIQDGINAVAEAGMVHVLAGLYLESNLTITKALTIDGQGRADVVIAPAAEDANLASRWGGAYQQGFIIQSSGVAIQDLTIDGQANPSLTPGKNNFRMGIATDDRLGASYNDLTIQNVTIQHTYFYGISNRNNGTGMLITGNRVEDVAYGAYPSYGILSFADGKISHNEVYQGGYRAIGAANSNVVVEENEVWVWDSDPLYGGEGIYIYSYDDSASVITVRANTIHMYNASVGGAAMNLVGLTDNTIIGGPNAADGNIIHLESADAADIGILNWWNVGQPIIQNNQVYAAGGDTGVFLFHHEQASEAPVVRGNVLTSTASDGSAAGQGTGIFITDDGTFMGDENGWCYAIIEGNTISGFARGIDLYQNAATPVGGRTIHVEIRGNNLIVGDGSAGSVGIRVYESNPAGQRAEAVIDGNSASLHGFETGILVNGGSATITGNAIYDNAVGIRFTAGGTGSVANNDFDDATDNTTDLRIDSTAGMVTVGDGNQFAGDNYYIDNRSALVFDLSAYTSTTFDVSDPARNDNFEIEDRMYHAPDDAAGGLITWVAGNLYVTTPGTGSSDETIQRAIDAASVGDTVNIETGTFVEQLEIAKPLTLLGAGTSTIVQSPVSLLLSYTTSGVNKPIVFVHDTDGVTIEQLRADGAGRGNANYRFQGIAYYRAGGVVRDVEIVHVTDTPFSGAQHGVALAAYADNGISRSLEVDGVNISDFQKNGMALNGAYLTVYVHGCTVTGAGDTAVTAQNGIQVGYGAQGLISGNQVSDVAYTGSYWGATAILGYGAGASLTISGNQVYNSQMGINVDTAATISGNIVTGHSANDWGIIAYDSATITGNTVSNVGGGIYVEPNAARGLTISDNSLTGTGGGDDVGLWIYGTPANAAFILGDSASFADMGTYIYLEDSAVNIDATGATFDGKLGWEMTLAELYAVEDKIYHATDAAGLGFVRVNDGNVYVTQLSGSIQRGINAATAGDTVNVQAGTYNLAALGGPSYEPISINKSLVLKGAGSGLTFFNAEFPSGHTDVVWIHSSDVTLEGISITGGDYGVRVNAGETSQANLAFTDVAVYQNRASGFVFDGTGSVSHIVFTDCQAVDNGGRGVYIAPGKPVSYLSMTNMDASRNVHSGFHNQGTLTHLNIVGGTFNDNKGVISPASYGSGIWLEYTTDAQIEDVVASGNGVVYPSHGVYVKSYSSNVRVVGGMFSNETYGVLFVDYLEYPPISATGNQISGNTITNVATAIANYYGIGDTISGNVISNVSSSGIFVRAGTATISGNEVHTGSGIGVVVEGHSALQVSALIQNNDLTGNKVGIQVKNNALVDAGGGTLGSVGHNVLTGYTGTGGNYAIQDLNPTGGPDVMAWYNDFGPYVNISMIEKYVWDVEDDPAVTNVDVSFALNQQSAPAVVYVDDDWAGTPLGEDPDGPGPATQFGVDAFAVIQEGIDAVAASGTVYVYAGSYIENLIIGKALSLLGPNAGLPGYDSGRGDEAVIRPAVNDPEFGNLVEVRASNVTIKGFLLNGDNPALGGGYDVGGVDVNVSEGLTNGYYDANYDFHGWQIDHLIVQDNIFRNFPYQGVYLEHVLGSRSSWNYIQYNLFDNAWEGIQTYAVHTDISYNQFDHVRSGLSIHGTIAAPESGFIPQIAHNEINLEWRDYPGVSTGVGIWVNYRRADAPALDVHDNVINAPASVPTGKTLRGIFGQTITEDRTVTFTNNVINGGEVLSEGYYFSNTPSRNVSISGGSVSDVKNVGVLVGYKHPTWGGGDARLTIDGLTIDMAAGGVGVKAYVDPSTPTKLTEVTITGSTITGGGGGAGVLVQGANASATIDGNAASIHGFETGILVDGGSAAISGNAIYGNTLGIRFTGGGTGSVANNDFDDATDNATDLRIDSTAGVVTVGDGNQFAGDTYYIDNLSTQSFDLSGHGSMTFDTDDPDRNDNFEIEDRMHHRMDTDLPLTTGLIVWNAGNVYVTSPQIANPDGSYSDSSIQRGVNAVGEYWTINVEAGTYDSQRFTSKPPHWGPNDQYAPALIAWKNNQTIKGIDGNGIPGDGIGDVVVQSTHDYWSNPVAIQAATGGVWNGSQYVGAGVNPKSGSAPNAISVIASGVTIDSLTIHKPYMGVDWGGFYNTAGVMIGGLYAGDKDNLGADGNTVVNCYFSDVWQAVYIWHSSGNLIQDNYVAALGYTDHWAAISVYDGYSNDQINLGYLSQNNQFIHNILENRGIAVGAWQPSIHTDNSGTAFINNSATQIGITYSDSADIVISGNTISGGSIWTNTVQLSNLTVTDNVVAGGAGNKIQLFNVHSGLISGNVVTNSSNANGIAILDSDNIEVSENTTTGNAASGIVLVRCSDAVVARNTIRFNTGNVNNPGGLTIREGNSDISIINNFIENNTIGVWVRDTALDGITVHYNSIAGNTTAGLQNNKAIAIDASANWWGSENGPTTPLNTYAYGSMTTGDAVIGNAIIAPWLTDGTDQEPDTPGFQPGPLDTTPPAVPSTPDMTDDSDTGISNTDNITKINTPTFVGTGEPGTTIALMEGDTVLGQTTADPGTGEWTIVSSLLGDGEHELYVRSTDQAGNSTVSDTLTVYIDTAAPLPNAGDDQIVNEGQFTTLTGTFDDDSGYGPYERLWHMVSSTNGQIVDDVIGDVLSFTPIDDGVYVFSYTVTDAAGNSAVDTVTVTALNVEPTLTLSGDASVNEGATYTLYLSSSDPGDDTIIKWTITWGDGAVEEFAGNPASVTHVYADGPNDYVISATATDEDGTYAAGNTVAVSVLNVAPTLTLDGAATVNEGATYTLYLSSSDPGDDTIIKWTITWGDGAVEEFAGNPASVTHVYADGPNDYVISATATDEDGTYAAGNTVAVHVNNVSPTIALTGDEYVNEAAIYRLTLGPVTDPGDDTPIKYYVNWGDGSPLEEFTTLGEKTHVYADGPAVRTIHVSIEDEDGLHPDAGTKTVSVVNVAPTGTFFNFGAVDEGSVGFVGFSNQYDVSAPDRAAGYRYSYDFNNDGIFEVINSTQAMVTVPASYLADGPGTCTVRGRIIDKDSGWTDYTTVITINNVEPVVNAGPDATISEGAAFTQAGYFVDPGADEWTALVDYDWHPGDMDAVPLTLAGKNFTLNHIYETAGVYIVRVTVSDDDGGGGEDFVTVTVEETTFQVMTFSANASGFDVTFNRVPQLDVLNLYRGKNYVSLGYGADADVTLVGAATGLVKGSLVWDADTKTATFVKTGGVLEPDTYTVTLFSRADGWIDTAGHLLDGDGNGIDGGNYTTTFVVSSSSTPIVSVPDFARGPGQPVNVAPNGTAKDAVGLPVWISEAGGALSVEFQMYYNPTLLDITDVTLASGMPSGSWNVDWNLQLIDAAHARLIVAVWGTEALPAGARQLVTITATVPETTPYYAAHALRFTDVEVNESPVRGDTAVHKVAYFGDADGNRRIQSLDASLVSRIAVLLDSGFDNYRLTDPRIVADATGDGRVTSMDAAYIAQKAVLLPRPEIPDLPSPLPPLVPGGIDPVVSVPQGIVAQPGSVVHMPVNIDGPGEAGLQSFDLQFTYDTRLLDLTNADVKLAGLTSKGWTMLVNADDAHGVVYVSAFAANPMTECVGSILDLAFRVPVGVSGRSVIGVAPSPNGGGLNGGELVLTTVDGSIVITPTVARSRAGSNAYHLAHDTALMQMLAHLAASKSPSVDALDGFCDWLCDYYNNFGNGKKSRGGNYLQDCLDAAFAAYYPE